MKTVADRFNEAFNESKFTTLVAVARAARLGSASTISDLKRGHVGGNSGALIAVAEVLGVCPKWLQRGLGPKRPGELHIVQSVELTDEIHEQQLQLAKELSMLIKAYVEASDKGRSDIRHAVDMADKIGRLGKTPSKPKQE